MDTDLNLNEDQQDCLQELMNVAYGSATASISELIDSFATLNIPDIQILHSSDLKNYLSDKLNITGEQFLAKQMIDGDLNGENIFLIDIPSTINLAHQFEINEEEIDEEELHDVVLEVTNILSSSTVGGLVEELNGAVTFMPPTVQKINSIDDMSDNYSTEYSHIFAIATELKFEEQVIRGELLLLTKDDSFKWMKVALDKILDEF